MEEIIPADPSMNPLTELISTNKISGIGDKCAIDFYNLRNVDDATKAKKKEQQRMREERNQNKRISIQNKRLRKQRKKKEAQEIVDRALKIREKLRQNYLRFEEEIKGREDLYYSIPEWRKPVPITEAINKPPDFEWVPYFSDDEFGRVSELKCTSWRVEELTLELARCMVGLESFTGDKQFFSCSGTIVEFKKGIAYVVTSASLVRLPHKDERADNLKINVCLPSGKILEGSVSNVDFCYNVEVPSALQLPTESFSADTEIFNFNGCHSKDVVALGRICKPWGLNVALGKLIPRRSQFDCEELLVSSCKISKRGVGGPLMDFDGNIIGMNFYDNKETPFLPGFIVLKCLQHLNDFGKVIRPLHGLRVKTLNEAQLTVLEKIYHVFPEVCGVIVEKVEVLSPEHSEIKVGDIITHVDGVPFSNAAEMRWPSTRTPTQCWPEDQVVVSRDGRRIGLQDDARGARWRAKECSCRRRPRRTSTSRSSRTSPSCSGDMAPGGTRALGPCRCPSALERMRANARGAADNAGGASQLWRLEDAAQQCPNGSHPRNIAIPTHQTGRILTINYCAHGGLELIRGCHSKFTAMSMPVLHEPSLLRCS